MKNSFSKKNLALLLWLLGLVAVLVGAVWGQTGTSDLPLTYTLPDGYRLTGYLSLPPQAAPDLKLPAVVLIHGGRGVNRQRPQSTAAPFLHLPPIKQHLLPHYAVFSVEYYEEYLGDLREVKSLAAALGVLAAHPQVDARRLVTLGVSRGGYLALLSVMHPEVQVRPQAAVSFAGIVDPAAQLQYMRDNRDKLPDFLRPFTQHTPSILGWPPRRDVKTRTRYERISVLSYVQNLHVPVCIIHGDQDNIVPVSQAHTLRDRLQQAGKPHRYLEIPGATHMNLMGLPQAWQQVEAFLSEVFH